MHDLVQEFSKEDIMVCQIKVVMVDARGNDEMGLDAKGIYRDAISCFWQEFYNTCTLGERERVPALRHDFQLSEWTAIARIIVKGLGDLEYFLVILSKAFLAGVIFSESQVAEEILLLSFYRCIAKDEEETLHQALHEGDISEEFIDLLDRFGCRKIPTKENAMNVILELAHKEIVQKPQYIADSWKDILQKGLHESKISSVQISSGVKYLAVVHVDRWPGMGLSII